MTPEAEARQAADARIPRGKLLVTAERILTLDPERPRVQAMAVEDGRVKALGRPEELEAWADPSTRRLHLGHGVVVPGFVESHAHLLSMGRSRSRLWVGTPPCRSIQDILDRVAEEAHRLPEGQWIVGVHYDDTLLREMRPPTADELSAAAPRHPVYLTHMSGHLAVANRLALTLAGAEEAQDTPGVVRDGAGRPTGELQEAAAMSLVGRLLPRETLEDQMRWLEEASRSCLAVGVTSMADAGLGGQDHEANRQIWRAYREVDQAGKLRVRTQLFPRLAAREDLPARWPSPFLSIGPVKLFADGSIQGHTGALRDPYHDRPGEDPQAHLFWQTEELARTVTQLLREGRQVATHANGDAAIDQVLQAYGAALAEVPATDHRLRVEHAQMTRADQLDRMKGLGVLPSFFVGHVEVLGDRHRDRFLGPERAANISPLAWALERGLVFSLHSDAPVTELDPLRSLRAAVTRRTASGAVLGPHQRVGGLAALTGYTRWAAYLGKREGEVGSLSPGRWADFAVLSGDPTEDGAGEELWESLAVEATYLAGELVWSR